MAPRLPLAARLPLAPLVPHLSPTCLAPLLPHVPLPLPSLARLVALAPRSARSRRRTCRSSALLLPSCCPRLLRPCLSFHPLLLCRPGPGPLFFSGCSRAPPSLSPRSPPSVPPSSLPMSLFLPLRLCLSLGASVSPCYTYHLCRTLSLSFSVYVSLSLWLSRPLPLQARLARVRRAHVRADISDCGPLLWPGAGAWGGSGSATRMSSGSGADRPWRVMLPRGKGKVGRGRRRGCG
jgi:hypothetical protein